MRTLALVVVLLFSGCMGSVDEKDPNVDPAGPAGPLWTDIRPAKSAGAEVSMAVDPNDPMHVVAASHHYGTSLVGRIAIYESVDGGLRWNVSLLAPGDLFDPSFFALSPYLNIGDPVVRFSQDSRLFLGGLAAFPGSAIFVAERTDQGWEAHAVWQSEVVATFNDKPWFDVGPTGTILVAWQMEPALDSLRDVDTQTDGAVDADVGIVVYSRSTDNGASWSLPHQLSHGLHANGTQVEFGTDGRAYISWVDYEDPHIDLIVSEDDGLTWAEPEVVSDVHIVGEFERFTRMHTLPGMSIGPAGEVAIVWHDARNDASDIQLAWRSDNEWAAHRVPDGEKGDGNVQFYPWVDINETGVAHVGYYGAANGTEDFSYRHVAYHPSIGFSDPGHASNITFTLFGDRASNPVLGESPVGSAGRNILDYTAVATGGPQIYLAWNDARDEDDVFIHVAHQV